MSTSWNAAANGDGRAIIEGITGLGFAALEVEYRVSEEAIPGIAEVVKEGRAEVLSVHNYAPLPQGERSSDWGGDKLSLAAPGESERKEAVRLTRRTVDLARSLGAQAVIVHVGDINLGRKYFRELCETVRAEGISSANAARLREDLRERRGARRRPYLEATARSLKDLLGSLGDSGLKICLENRYYYHQIPLPDEVAKLKEELSSPDLCYWHDTGHAHVQEILGFGSHAGSLGLLRDHLFGMHVHDSVFIDDHQPPGSGEIDFAGLLAMVPASTLKIMELASSVKKEDVVKGARYLETLGVYR
jgi:sugar phosphate isomerase/epimerase